MEAKVNTISPNVQKDMRNIHFTEDQAAIFLNLKKRTLQAWRGQGRGPRFVKMGRAIRYQQNELKTYVDTNTRRSTSGVKLSKNEETPLNNHKEHL